MSIRNPFITSFSKGLQSSFKGIYRDKITIETSTIPAICIFKISNPILQLLSQTSGTFISFVTSLSQNAIEQAQSKVVYHVLRVIERSKSIFDGILKCAVCLGDHFLKILQVLTRVVTSLNQNWVKRTQTCISCNNGDRKLTIKSKRRFQVKYLFLKLFSPNLEIQVPCCDLVISKLGQRDSNLESPILVVSTIDNLFC